MFHMFVLNFCSDSSRPLEEYLISRYLSGWFYQLPLWTVSKRKIRAIWNPLDHWSLNRAVMKNVWVCHHHDFLLFDPFSKLYFSIRILLLVAIIQTITDYEIFEKQLKSSFFFSGIMTWPILCVCVKRYPKEKNRMIFFDISLNENRKEKPNSTYENIA